MLEKLTSFLTSLAPITGFGYLIHSADGQLRFATQGDGAAPIPETVHQLSRRIIEDKTFLYSRVDLDKFLCGCPILNGTRMSSTLVAYGPIQDKGELGEHSRQIEAHLNHTLNLINENADQKAEVKELALQLEHSFEDLYLYSQISNQIKSLTLSEQMLHNIMMEIVENMHVDTAFITFPQRPQFDMQILRPVSKFGPENWESFLFNLQECARPHIDTAEENYIIINNSLENSSYKTLATVPYRFLMTGVRYQEDLYGWIGLASFNVEEIFRQGELRMLKSLAEQLAIVIANTDLYTNLEQFTVNMVRSLVYAIEAKDPYTHGHSERVYQLTMQMAKQCKIKDDAFETLKWAAILHDVGKIGISEQILLKPGKLTDEEFNMIKAHPEKGGKILQPVSQLAGSLGGIVHHHERYDGKGYPHGLKGKAIPLAARIIAVADTFDAITSDRPYRKAKTHQQALDIIKSVSGTQLDPKIVNIFEAICAQRLVKTNERSTIETPKYN